MLTGRGPGRRTFDRPSVARSRISRGRRGEQRRGEQRRDEHGAFLVLWVLAAVVILLFAALAIDLGNIAQSKQHAQDAADNAAVSAVADLASIQTGAAAPAQEAEAVADAEAYVTSNYSSITSGWNCPNALPPQVTPFPSATCIGFFNPADSSQNLTDPTGIAVAIPTQNVSYTFGKAGGLRSQGVSAVATASLQGQSPGYLLPFGFTGGASGLQCLKTGSGANARPCNVGFAIGSGQFGVLNSPRYRVLPGNSPSGTNGVIMADIDLGIDHLLKIGPPASNICDAAQSPPNCLAYNNVLGAYDYADYAAPQTGGTLNDPGPALFNADQNPFPVANSGCVISTPRLAHGDGFQAKNDCTFDNTPGAGGPFLNSVDTFGSSANLNGEHITRYLIGGTGNPYWTSCYAGQGPDADLNPSNDPIDEVISNKNVWSGSGTNEDACLSNAMAGMNNTSPAIFSTSLIDSPRFGVVPVVNPVPGRSFGGEQITGFLGVFIDQAFGQNDHVDSIESWVFPLNLIQGGIANDEKIGAFTGAPPIANLCSLSAGNC